MPRAKRNASRNATGPVLHGMPDKIRCKICAKMTSVAELSARQESQLRLRVRQHGFSPEHDVAICRPCGNNDSAKEICCLRCNTNKVLSEYSKNSLREERFECKRCIGWQEIQEPKCTPTPEVTGHISPEEILNDRQMKKDTHFIMEGFEGPKAPISGPSALGLEDTAQHRALLDDFLPNAHAAYTQSPPGVFGNPAVAGTPYMNRVSRARQGVQNVSSRALGVSTAGRNLTPSTISTATTLREDGSESARNGPQSFNAWDAHGQRYRHVPNTALSTTESVSTPGVSSIAPSQTSENVSPREHGNVPRRSKGWHKPEKLTAEELRNF